MRPSTLTLVTWVTVPVAIASSALVPSIRVHVNADRIFLALVWTVDPTINRGSPLMSCRWFGVQMGN